ncbi:hypothetical protein [Roseimaritima sediminicola]|uniref:hypothetical protein n=1 Tax=Roseimaritima sediminicola TaxID=2662066 RepID=UPI00192A577A|nr:hypothetical protein [Roseimaritima sediminicola]
MSNILSVETFLLELAQLFQWPVIVTVLLVFGYAVLQAGGFVIEGFRRVRRPGAVLLLPRGGDHSIEALELVVLRELEGLRLCSRIAPMLGLVATMIPLGPALVAVSNGRGEAMGDSLAAAFAAVIVALLAASLTFAIHTVRRRWLLQELNTVLDQRTATPEAESPARDRAPDATTTSQPLAAVESSE